MAGDSTKNRLRESIMPFIAALRASKLTHLDITGHGMGTKGKQTNFSHL